MTADEPTFEQTARVSETERLRRWRLVLGAAAAGDEVDDDAGVGSGDAGTGDNGAGGPDEPGGPGETGSGYGRGLPRRLSADDRRLDAALGVIYDAEPSAPRTNRSSRRGGPGRSAPAVARWLGDIRRYFPATVVQVLQRDAIERFDLRRLLLEPELIDTVEADVSLVALVIELNRLLPVEVRESARLLVARVVAELQDRLAERARRAVNGALSKANRTSRPRPRDIDWNRTVLANLRNWLPEQATVVPDRLVGFERRRSGLARELVIAVDQSASMADSVVYASLMACVLARIPALRTSLVVFDTTVADLSHLLGDPVDVMFGVQLGGGTDIAQAVDHTRRLITRPSGAIAVVVSDLFEGGDDRLLVSRVASMVRDGVRVLCLLALTDDGVGAFDHHTAASLAAVGADVCGCTPDALGDLLAAVIDRRDIRRWASEQGFATVVGARRE